jgi:hypothetical protein
MNIEKKLKKKTKKYKLKLGGNFATTVETDNAQIVKPYFSKNPI